MVSICAVRHFLLPSILGMQWGLVGLCCEGVTAVALQREMECQPLETNQPHWLGRGKVTAQRVNGCCCFSKNKVWQFQCSKLQLAPPSPWRRQARELGPTPQTKAGQQEGAPSHTLKGVGSKWSLTSGIWERVGDLMQLILWFLLARAGAVTQPLLLPRCLCSPAGLRPLDPLCSWLCSLWDTAQHVSVGTMPQLEEHSRNSVMILLLEPALQLCHSSSFPVTSVALLRLIMQ